MPIDWFTVTAQIINFLVLVYLLKRFLYGPIIEAMDKREERIAARLREAGEKAEKADMEAASYQSMKAELEQTREKVMEETRAEAEKKRKEMMEQARGEVDSIRRIWEEDLERDKDSFLRQLRLRTADRIMVICRKAFFDIANTELESHAVEAFLDRVRRMDDKERAAFAEALRGRSGGVVVTSRFDIPEQTQKKIAGQLREVIDGATAVKFEKSESLICGIEIESDGRKVSWSLDSYLADLEDEIHKTISEKNARRV